MQRSDKQLLRGTGVVHEKPGATAPGLRDALRPSDLDVRAAPEGVRPVGGKPIGDALTPFLQVAFRVMQADYRLIGRI